MNDFELDTLVSAEEKQFLEQHLVCNAVERGEAGDVRYVMQFKHSLVADTAALLVSQFRSERLAAHRDAHR